MTKEEEFKHRFVSVLDDIQKQGSQDGEVMAMIGTLAADIARSMGQTSWTGVKSTLTADSYDELLSSFQKQGNALHAEGKIKQSYAIQALAVSLIAKTQRADRDLEVGEKLLDALIDQAVAHVMRVAASRAN